MLQDAQAFLRAMVLLKHLIYKVQLYRQLTEHVNVQAVARVIIVR